MKLPTNPVEIIEGMLVLFSDEAKWTKNLLAKNADGQDVACDSPEATCFCMMGGIDRVTYGVEGETNEEATCMIPDLKAEIDTYDYIHNAVVEKGGSSIPSFNDSTDYPTMMTVLNRALELAKEKA